MRVRSMVFLVLCCCNYGSFSALARWETRQGAQHTRKYGSDGAHARLEVIVMLRMRIGKYGTFGITALETRCAFIMTVAVLG